MISPQVLLSFSCLNCWLLNGHLVIKILSLSLSLYNGGGTAVKAAAQANCSQTIVEYCKQLGILS